MTLVWLPFAGPDEARRRLGELPAGLDVDFYPADGDEPPASIADVELYVLPYLRPGAERLIAQMPRLRAVQTLTAGVDDVAPHVPAGVTLCNAAGVHDASTAELAVALILASGRHLDVFARQQAESRWHRIHGTALADRRVLIFGYGHIGQAIEARLAGFEVASITRVARRARGEPTVRSSDDLPDLLGATDVLVVIAPLTPETEGVIGAEALSRPARRGARGQRRPGPAGRHRRAARRDAQRSPERRARRHGPGAAARRPPAVAGAERPHLAPRRWRELGVLPTRRSVDQGTADQVRGGRATPQPGVGAVEQPVATTSRCRAARSQRADVGASARCSASSAAAVAIERPSRPRVAMISTRAITVVAISWTCSGSRFRSSVGKIWVHTEL